MGTSRVLEDDFPAKILVEVIGTSGYRELLHAGGAQIPMRLPSLNLNLRAAARDCFDRVVDGG